MKTPELVVEKEQFLASAEECQTILDTRKRLPDFVFRRTFPRYFVIEHAHVFGKDFAAFLLKIANLCQDESVNYMTIIPDAVDYYHRHCSFFGLASFSPDTLIERYVPVMTREGSADSFRARGGDVGVFWGSSLKWGISCDRISWELAVIAVPENVDVPRISGFRCMKASWLSGYIRSQYSNDVSVATSFTKTFLANYPI